VGSIPAPGTSHVVGAEEAPAWILEHSVKPQLKTVAIQTILFVAALALIGALGIWFDLGPAVHSGGIAH
jgi:hypothetical protein